MQRKYARTLVQRPCSRHKVSFCKLSVELLDRSAGDKYPPIATTAGKVTSGQGSRPNNRVLQRTHLRRGRRHLSASASYLQACIAFACACQLSNGLTHPIRRSGEDPTVFRAPLDRVHAKVCDRSATVVRFAGLHKGQWSLLFVNKQKEPLVASARSSCWFTSIRGIFVMIERDGHLSTPPTTDAIADSWIVVEPPS